MRRSVQRPGSLEMYNRAAMGGEACCRMKTNWFTGATQYRIRGSNDYKMEIYIIKACVFQSNIKLNGYQKCNI